MIILNGGETLTHEHIYSLVGKIKAINYTRVSTTDQARHGFSLDSQIERCKDRAMNTHGYKEDEIITLVEAGGSGDDPNRPALNYALYLMEKGLGKKIIILHPDRLSRDNILQGIVSRKIWSLGVDIDFIEFDVDPNNPESMLMYNIQGSIAQYNKAKILANSKRGRIQKAKKGEIPSFKRLYGYSFNQDIDMLEINESEEEIIKLMVDMLLNDGKSCNQIAKELSVRGIEAPNGNIWYQTTVTRILRNEDYLGTFYYGKSQVVQNNGKRKQVPRPKEEWIAVPIPPILDNEIFQKVQMQIDNMSKNKGRKSTSYLLKGIAKCGRCGGAAGSGITSKVQAGTYKYYACRKKASKGYEVGTGKNTNVCKGRNWRVDIVDEVVWGWLVRQLSNPKEIIESLNKLANDSSQYQRLESDKIHIEKQLTEIKKEELKYAMLFGKDKLTEEMYDQLNEPLKKQKEALESDLKLIINKLIIKDRNNDEFEKIIKMTNGFKKAINITIDSDEKKSILKMFLERVDLHEDGRIRIVSKWGTEEQTLDNLRLNQHAEKTKKQNSHQDDRLIFYVESKIDLPKPQFMNGQFKYSWEKYQSELDKLVELNHEKLLTSHEIQKGTGISIDDLENLFKNNGIKLYKLKELSKKKRELDFDFLYNQHFNKRLSLNDIYREFGFSPGYTKKCFEDKGLKHLNFVNQLK